jgi:hypothetical protein
VGIGTATPGAGIKLDVLGGEIKAGRVDSSSEGGQVSFGRASDNTTAWYIDAYGNTSTPSLRFVDVGAGAVSMGINSSGAVALRGAVSASGVGITFPATQSASSDANTLDDYEEGSFTPIFAAGGGTVPTTQTGTGAYIKVGRVVHLHGQIAWTGSGSGGSNLRVDLPFIVVSGARGALALGIISGFNWSAGHQLSLVPELNTTVAYIMSKDPAGGGHVHRTLSDVSTTGSYLFSFAGSYVTSN